MRALLAFMLLAATPASAQQQTWRFDWIGAGGYAMRGALAFDAADGPLITEAQAICFHIDGFRDDRPIGRWALGMLRPDTTWAMAFDAARGSFVVHGPEAPMPQAWNMDGAGTDCGPGGFGFNIGNAAQDLCLDGVLLFDSQVYPDRPFPAVRDDAYRFPADACRGSLPMSALTPPAVAAAASR